MDVGQPEGRRVVVTGPRGGEYEIDLLPDGRWAIPAGRESWEKFAYNAPEELLWLVLRELLAEEAQLRAAGEKAGGRRRHGRQRSEIAGLSRPWARDLRRPGEETR